MKTQTNIVWEFICNGIYLFVPSYRELAAPQPSMHFNRVSGDIVAT